ncbi:hypothetical protein SCOR_02120 [Sulfidibacter corallicola]|uniref:Uncharacterized protein n=1 Tax=Sulfidibacter corallicola TaxID=2818388 RepID=A0A8A4TIK5_SULCO|nr:hypothetical protein [Sulfidibacter corallicola]QTD48681.1 hypothetical protein J3U87_24125 [Sulfidibacter corallicola]
MTTTTSVQTTSEDSMTKLTWAYKDFSHDHISEVIKEVTNFLLKLSPAQASKAKVAICDKKDGNARGIVYYVSNGDISNISAFLTNWTDADEYSDKDYIQLYRFGLDTINGLDNDQALSCHVGFTNRKDGKAHLCVWYGQNLEGN